MKRLLVPILIGVAIAVAAVGAGCASRAVAKVNGEVINEQELCDRLQVAQGRQVLDRLILERIIRQKAKEKGVTVTEAEVNDLLGSYKQQAGDRWADYLKMTGQTEEDLKRDVRDNLIVAKLVIPEDQVKQYWEQNRTRFDEGSTVKYQRIILKNQAEAAKTRGEITTGKLDFSQAVKTLSQDPLAKEDGIVGPAPEGSLGDPELEKVLFSLPLKQVSEPIAMTYPQGAYQLVRVIERTQAKKMTFEQARPRAIQAVMQTRAQEISTFLRDLRGTANVTIFPARYQALAEEYAKYKEQKPPTITPTPQMPVAPAPSKGPAPAEKGAAPAKPAEQPK